MISSAAQHLARAPLSLPRLRTPVVIAWDVALPANHRAIARVTTSIEQIDDRHAALRIHLDRRDGSSPLEIARADTATLTHDEERGLLHLDLAEPARSLAITLRSCRDGVSLLYARSNIFHSLRITGGRIEPPVLLVSPSTSTAQ